MAKDSIIFITKLNLMSENRGLNKIWNVLFLIHLGKDTMAFAEARVILKLKTIFQN